MRIVGCEELDILPHVVVDHFDVYGSQVAYDKEDVHTLSQNLSINERNASKEDISIMTSMLKLFIISTITVI
ncbi:uncharacterized protein PHALS_15272 [Plasmopara halstedii]|uniref:Uncharacterized protein n=1 Tax=Plasmopara halstedii TaxID=4781 RepID=A0A0N7L8N4_PLAHL|nr:uncharacterized protein PHALS_15272 [Plasmopara halstedii]CEG50363.1 hypothetical protein PHALS_15272 [Plasmopara halstedii]|eukprot:XP_024586732.1 hypothetical protein PHALS_15272 [Plasmopara halstedii]